MIPSERLLFLIAVGLLPLLLGVAFPPFTTVGLSYDLFLAVLLVIDGVASPGPGRLEASREGVGLLSIGADNRLVLRIRNLARVPVLVRARESLHESFVPARVGLSLALGPGGEGAAPYLVRPTRRGEYPLAPLTLRVRSRLGLFWRQRRIDLGGALRVYPDVNALRQFELAVRRDRLAELGMRRVRWLGAGTEFESLREYSHDDAFRAIDWKATARRGRPIARQHQLERSQSIMLMLDAGRLMTREFAGLSRLDHAINAAMLLAYVAMTRGDRVGLLTFGEKLERFVPPVSGQAILPTLMDGLYDLVPTLRESDYRSAFEVLTVRHRKRSLVVVFTEVSSLEASDALVGYLSGLTARHLALVVCIRDVDIARRADGPGGSEREVLEKAAAVTLVEEREAALRHLEQRGALVVDVGPDELNLAVVNRYLELKARGRL